MCLWGGSGELTLALAFSTTIIKHLASLFCSASPGEEFDTTYQPQDQP